MPSTFSPTFLLSLSLALPALANAQLATVHVTSSTQAGVQPMRTEKPVELVAEIEAEAGEVVFTTIPKNLRQKIHGYGAAFTEACTMHMDKLSPPLRRDTLNRLFSKDQGAGLDMMRLPIGGTDFGDGTKGGYTYNDTKGNLPDPKFLQFDMTRDEPTFQLIREALKINPNMQIMISPWSAPAWMKTSKSIFGGELQKKHYKDYANYLVKVIKEYRKLGFPITAMTIQNEPFFAWEGVPSMHMNWDMQSEFINKHLAPALKKNGVTIRIYGHDHNFDAGRSVVEKLLGNPETRKNLTGAAFHCYNGHRYEAVDTVRTYPEMEIMNTECSDVDTPERNDESSFHSWLEVQAVDSIRLMNSGSIAWNLCLDDKHGPKNMGNGKVGCSTCRGLIDIDFSGASPRVVYNPEYHAFAQVSRFLTPGSRAFEVNGAIDGEVYGVGVLTGDKKVILIGHNMRTVPATISFRGLNGKMLKYEMPARSVISFVIE